jgi:phosphotransferase system IIB component
MKTNTLILLLLFFSINSYSKNNNQSKVDSSYSVNLERKISHLESLIKSNDSLNKELIHYKVKEDYYSVALSDQGERFTLIVSGILALFALGSFGIFKYEMLKINEEVEFKLSEQRNKVKKQKKKLSKTISELKSANGNLNTSIGIHFEKEKDYKKAFKFYLYAADRHGNSAKRRKKSKENSEEINHYETCIANLKLALKNLKLINKDNINIDKFKKEFEKGNKTIDTIYALNNEEVKNLISEIRIELQKLFL